MPAQLITVDSKSVSKKRKRTGAVEKSRKDGSNKAAKPAPSAPSAEEVLELEAAIVESPQNYNKIVELLECVQVCFFVGSPGVCGANDRIRTCPGIPSWR